MPLSDANKSKETRIRQVEVQDVLKPDTCNCYTCMIANKSEGSRVSTFHHSRVLGHVKATCN